MADSGEIKEFLSYIASERALSQNTLLAYQQDLEQFIVFARVKKIELLSPTLEQLRMFLAHLRKQGLSTRSLARKVSAIRQFYKFLLREEKIQADPAELLSVMVKANRLPKHLTLDEMTSLLEAATGATEREIRDRALLELWYATGARVSEMAELPVDAFDWKEGVVKILGKGRKERLVPVAPQAIEWCQKYKAIRHEWIARNGLKEDRRFFLTLMGKGFTRQGIWKIVKIYAEKAGIKKRVWPHMIRHSFATHILLGGADLRAVQELMGHKSIATTEVYTHLDIENLKQMQLKYHPRG